MNRILSWLGCFGLMLLAILFALGVTESIKYVGSLEKALVLTAAVLAAAAVAYLRDRLKNGPIPALHKDEPTQRSKDQPFNVDLDARLPPQTPQISQSSPPPIHDAILAARTQAILFRQIVPPNHDPAHLSFFGRLPIAPSGFQWPRGKSRPYSFIMQLDCSAVPSDGRLGIFPDDGVLYVFLKLEWGYEEGYEDTFRVIYEPGPAQGWAEVAPPDDLPHAFDSKLAWKWPQSDADWPHLLPKWPFDPVLIQGGPLPDDPEGFEETYAWPGTVFPNEAIAAIEGAVAQYLSFGYQRGQAKTAPFANFPHDWNAVRITTGLIAKAMKRADSVRDLHLRNLSEEEYAAKLAEAQVGLSDWSDRASVAAPFDDVPAAERERFWSWLQEYEWLTFMPMNDAGALSVEATLSASPEAAARVPLEVVDYIRCRHALACNTERGLHMKTPDRILAAPVDVQGDIDERVREFILLLELSSDEGLAHYFGEGVYQFWIRPDDLAARRFERVELSTTAY